MQMSIIGLSFLCLESYNLLFSLYITEVLLVNLPFLHQYSKDGYIFSFLMLNLSYLYLCG